MLVVAPRAILDGKVGKMVAERRSLVLLILEWLPTIICPLSAAFAETRIYVREAACLLAQSLGGLVRLPLL
jgi:hypothetical protein